MKYIRKVMAIGLAIIFLIALVIGTGIILSVRNVNVTYIDSSGKRSEQYEVTRNNLNKLKGSGLLFIDDNDVAEKISSPEYIAVESYEKKFPCTVDVVLRERVETFACKNEIGYSVYDEKGKLIKTTVDDFAPANEIDGCPDIIVEAEQPDQIESIAAMCGYFGDNFGSLRRLVQSVAANRYLDIKIATITLRTGLTISLSEWQSSTEQKIRRAYEIYARLDDAERIKGSITVVDGTDAGPVARYSAERF